MNVFERRNATNSILKQPTSEDAFARYSHRLRAFSTALNDHFETLECRHYLCGFLKSLYVGGLIHISESDDLTTVFPSIADVSAENVPLGPEVENDSQEHPEVSRLGDDILLDPFLATWIGVKNALHSAELANTRMSNLEVLLWLGYLQASVETHEFSDAQRETLRSLLPPVTDPFTPLMQRLAIEDGTLPQHS